MFRIVCPVKKKEKKRKNVRYYDLDCKLMKGEGRYLLNCLNECESAEDQRLRLAKYKDKRREYKSLIKWRKNLLETIRISRNWTLLMNLRKKKFLRSFVVIYGMIVEKENLIPRLFWKLIHGPIT